MSQSFLSLHPFNACCLRDKTTSDCFLWFVNILLPVLVRFCNHSVVGFWPVTECTESDRDRSTTPVVRLNRDR